VPLLLEVATPARLLVSEAVEEVVAPGTDGYFGVLPGHAPFLTTLGAGELMYRQNGRQHHLAVSGGFAEVRNDKVIVLADAAERPEEIDRARAERALQQAERSLAGPVDEAVDYAECSAAAARARVRLLVVSRAH
jgi:F-type H+-transporting ATPase subunit epsilon